MVMTAKQVLDNYWNNTAPIDPKKIAENIGIIVKYKPLGDKISGIIKNNRFHHIEIHVNKLHSEERQRFTIAHELGHYFSSEDFNQFEDADNLLEIELLKDRKNDLSDYDERNANSFALELLMPKIAIDYMLKTGKASTIGDLAKIFKVSLSVMNIRLIKLGYIDG